MNENRQPDAFDKIAAVLGLVGSLAALVAFGIFVYFLFAVGIL